MLEIKVINKIEDKVNEYRETTGATKTWIANKVGLSKQTLQTVSKSNNPTIGTMAKIAFALDCRIEELYEVEYVEDNRIHIKSRK